MNLKKNMVRSEVQFLQDILRETQKLGENILSIGGGMVYPAAGIPVSTGVAWAGSIIDNSTNWNTAYTWTNTHGANAVTAFGWGNHASAGYQAGDATLTTLSALADGAGVLTNNGAGVLSWAAAGGGQTPWTSNINGAGYTLFGNSTAGGNLTLSSSSNATKGKILFGTSAYDEVNNRLGLGTTTPSERLDLGAGNFTTTGSIYTNKAYGQRIYGENWYTRWDLNTQFLILQTSHGNPLSILNTNYQTHAFSSEGTSDGAAIGFHCDNMSGDTWRAAWSNANVIKSKSGGLRFYANTNGGGGTFTATERMRITTGGVNIMGATNPTAYLHIEAGTATASTAPLKLTAGTNLTIPENGAFEFDGSNLYFTVGGVRKTITLV